MRGVFAWVGYRSIGIPHERPPRFGGESKAHSLKVLDLAFKGIFAHSYVSLRLITVTGLSVSLLSAILWVVFSFRFIVYGVPFARFGTLVGFILLMFVILFSMIGVVSEYVGLIYEEVKQRPNFIVRRKVGLCGVCAVRYHAPARYQVRAERRPAAVPTGSARSPGAAFRDGGRRERVRRLRCLRRAADHLGRVRGARKPFGLRARRARRPWAVAVPQRTMSARRVAIRG